MGILDLVGGVAGSVGKFTTETAAAYIQSNIVDQRDQRLNEMVTARELASDTRREGYALGREERGYKQQDSILGKQQTHAKELQAAGFDHDYDLLGARQAFDEEQKALDRTLSREQIAAQERIHKSDRASAERIAMIGGTIQADPEGNVFMVGKTGVTKQIMDPREPDKPLKTAKDLTPGAKAYSDMLTQRLKAIDSNLMMAPEEKAAKEKALKTELVGIILRGTEALKAEAGPTIPKTQAEYDALPNGATYLKPDGKPYVKKVGDKAPKGLSGAVTNEPAGILAQAPPPHPQSVLLPIVRGAARRGEQWAIDELDRRGAELDSTVPYRAPE